MLTYLLFVLQYEYIMYILLESTDSVNATDVAANFSVRKYFFSRLSQKMLQLTTSKFTLT